MKRNIIFLLVAVALLGCNKGKGQQNKLTLAEKKSFPKGLNAFVDISHWDEKVDLKIAKNAGLVGFFHKTTQHTDFEDPKYGERVKKARELGLMVGAYHFASAAKVDEQVEYFISVIDKYGSEGIVPCLDWEKNFSETEGTMTQEQVLQFIDLFYEKTGVYPVIYGGYWMINMLGGEQNIGNLPKCPLWQGFYSAAFGYLDGIWDNWTFLQYTDGTLGPEPHSFEGIGKVDRDIFNGDLTSAKTFWKKNSLK